MKEWGCVCDNNVLTELFYELCRFKEVVPPDVPSVNYADKEGFAVPVYLFNLFQVLSPVVDKVNANSGNGEFKEEFQPIYAVVVGEEVYGAVRLLKEGVSLLNGLPLLVCKL